jgi:hypothetical protein
MCKEDGGAREWVAGSRVGAGRRAVLGAGFGQLASGWEQVANPPYG